MNVYTSDTKEVLDRQQKLNQQFFRWVNSLSAKSLVIYIKRNASNTPFNTHFSTHSLWLVKIHTGPTKSCGSYILFVGPMWIL